DGGARRDQPSAWRSPLFRRAGTDQSRRLRVEARVSRYEVNSLLYRLKKDRAYRERFLTDAEGVLQGLDLNDEERSAFVARDMTRINALGGCLHPVMSITGLAVHITHPERE